MIKPFRALRPTPNNVDHVIAPPYDVVTTAEAAHFVEGKPWNFLHLSRPEIDAPHATKKELYQRAHKTLQAMCDTQIMMQDDTPCYYVYRMTHGTQQQTGIAAIVSDDDYTENRYRKHEHTRPDKVADRLLQIKTLQAQTGPLLSAFRPHPTLQTLLARACEQASPTYDTLHYDGVRHQIWVVDDPQMINDIQNAAATLHTLYIADGHHRAEAGSQAVQDLNPEFQHLFVIAFPSDELEILAYHRIVNDLNGLSTDDFLERISHTFHITPDKGLYRLHLDGRWIHITPHQMPTSDPVTSHPAQVLFQSLLSPILGIQDERNDPRVHYIGGTNSLDVLKKRVDSGEMQLGIAMPATTMAQLLSVADAGKVMPPKSTWFEPKLVDGLLSYLIH